MQYLEEPVYYKNLTEDILKDFVFLHQQDREDILRFLHSGRSPSQKDFIAFLKKRNLYLGLKPFIKFEKRKIRFKNIISFTSIASSRSYFSIKDASYFMHVKYSGLHPQQWFVFGKWIRKHFNLVFGHFWQQSPLRIVSGGPAFNSGRIVVPAGTKPVIRLKRNSITNSHGGVVLEWTLPEWNFQVGLIKDFFGLKELPDGQTSFYSNPWEGNPQENFNSTHISVAVERRFSVYRWAVSARIPLSGMPRTSFSPFDYLQKPIRSKEKEFAFLWARKSINTSIVAEYAVTETGEWVLGAGYRYKERKKPEINLFLGKSSDNYFSVYNSPFQFHGRSAGVLVQTALISTPSFYYNNYRFSLTAGSDYLQKRRVMFYGDSTLRRMEYKLRLSIKGHQEDIKAEYGIKQRQSEHSGQTISHFTAAYQQAREGGDAYEIAASYIWTNQFLSRGRGIIIESKWQTAFSFWEFYFSGIFFKLNPIPGGVYWGHFSPWKANQWLRLSGEGLKFSFEATIHHGLWDFFISLEQSMKISHKTQKWIVGFVYRT